MGFSSKARSEKQGMIDDYLNKTGRNMFVPAEFLAWLKDNTDHPAYEIFYSLDDEAAAFEHRKQMVRQWASGLRITVKVETVQQRTNKVKVTEREVPAMVSPMAGRKSGGGYFVTNVDDEAHVAELRQQAAWALQSWLDRYGGVAEMAGCNLTAIEKTVGALRNARVLAAA